ncbi:hypothetical protein [Jiangella endophytica]|uniref:hypothetical protein n=1 Tax=Jiangella endophytica TaxID=1623398 RepID=UPI0013006C3D|nr:hypothetical protein [Jiangella endophytica]
MAIIAAILTSGSPPEAILPPDAAATDVSLAQPTDPPPEDVAAAPDDRDGPSDDRHGHAQSPTYDRPGGDAVGGRMADGSSRTSGSLGDDAATDAIDAPDAAHGVPGSGGLAGSAPHGEPSVGGADGSGPDGLSGPGGDGSGADDAPGSGGVDGGGAAGDGAPPSSAELDGAPAGWSEVARGFGLAFTRTGVGRDAWFATMSSWLTPEQAARYRDVPIEAIPTGELTQIDVADPGSAAHAQGTLTYDTGMVLDVGLSYRPVAGSWLVARVELANGTGPG